MNSTTIGQKIRKIREIKGFKQEYMAEQLDISQQSYSNIESDKIDVPFSKIQNIAEILGMRVEDIISFDEKYVLNNYGEIKEYQYGNIQNYFPEKLQQLYEDKIKLLEDKIQYLSDTIEDLKSK